MTRAALVRVRRRPEGMQTGEQDVYDGSAGTKSGLMRCLAEARSALGPLARNGEELLWRYQLRVQLETPYTILNVTGRI